MTEEDPWKLSNLESPLFRKVSPVEFVWDFERPLREILGPQKSHRKIDKVLANNFCAFFSLSYALLSIVLLLPLSSRWKAPFAPIRWKVFSICKYLWWRCDGIIGEKRKRPQLDFCPNGNPPPQGERERAFCQRKSCQCVRSPLVRWCWCKILLFRVPPNIFA